ncbi:bifunctional hydroxymethylpyrimidine kinase/phosphomethylpyrimidine kinase [Pseudomonas sp. Env-44]|uniref:Bifunctional hydroxymethylpyrimidine kinase/phosphomethylpyrimidine kinase n=1 Tax=Pseudomonas ficuserectae TaxID=53410 RepID=A0ABV4Q0D8_9PSED
MFERSAPCLKTRNSHGTGCTLSAAIAALLPTLSVGDSVRQAKVYLPGCLAASEDLEVGKGHGPLHHFYRL